MNASLYSPDEVGGADRWKKAAAWGFGGALNWCAQPTYQDPNVTARAVAYMKLAKDAARQFFLGVGLHKPHLPFQAPQEYFDLYPVGNVTLPKHRAFPKDAPPIAFRDNNGHPDVPSPWIPLPDQKTRDTRRAYMAAVSFMDAQLGVLLGALRELDLEPNTAVLFHGDHGWHLGEHGMWRKMTNFELATRVPLVIHVPWLPAAQGQRTSQLVELIDILPTLSELGGVQMPTNQTYDGVSLVPLINGSRTSIGKNSSFSQFARVPIGAPSPPLNNGSGLWVEDNEAGPRSGFYAMGHSMRTEQWRYTEWVRWNATGDGPAWDLPLIGRELYRHHNDLPGDFDHHEASNIAADPEQAQVVAGLQASLRNFFRRAECRNTLCSPEEERAAAAAQGMLPA